MAAKVTTQNPLPAPSSYPSHSPEPKIANRIYEGNNVFGNIKSTGGLYNVAQFHHSMIRTAGWASDENELIDHLSSGIRFVYWVELYVCSWTTSFYFQNMRVIFNGSNRGYKWVTNAV